MKAAVHQMKLEMMAFNQEVKEGSIEFKRIKPRRANLISELEETLEIEAEEVRNERSLKKKIKRKLEVSSETTSSDG